MKLPKIPKVDFVTVALVVAFVTWIAFSVLNPNPPPIAGQAFLTMLGVWVTNKAYRQQKQDDKLAAKLEALESVAETAHPDVAHEKGIEGHA